jgi:hypothetical protein
MTGRNPPPFGEKMISMGRLLMAATAALLLAGPALAASETEVNARIAQVLGNAPIYETMVKTFQHAVAAGHKEDVAAFVRYPIRVVIDGRKTTIRSARDFVQHYEAIMTPDIVAAVTAQKYGDLLINSQGIMFGNGEVWINGICHDRRCSVSVPEVITIQHAN